MSKHLLWVVALAALGCAHAPASDAPASHASPAGPSRSSSSDAAHWHEVATPHFHVYAQADQAHAIEMAKHLEAIRAALLLAFDPQLSTPLPVEVVVFSSREEVKWFVAPRQLGYTRYSDSELRIVMSAEAFGEGENQFTATVAHELTHYLSQYAIRQQPRWVAEGLATFLETLTLTKEGQAVFGRPPWIKLKHVRALFDQERGAYGRHDTLPWLWKWSEMTLEQVRAISADQEQSSYSLAWAWMHLLLSKHRPELDAFYAGLNRGDLPRAAFLKAFAQLPALEDELRAYVRTELPAYSQPLPDLSAQQLRVRAMNDASVHALRARLFIRDKPPLPNPQQFIDYELTQALKIDPSQVEAQMLSAERIADPKLRFVTVRDLAQRTGDGRVWTLVAQLLLDAPDLEPDLAPEAFARAGALLDDPRALTLAALGMGTLGDIELAKRHADRALALAPWSTAANFSVAVVAKTMGDCTKADEAARNAVALLRHRSDATNADEMARRFAAIPCQPR